MAFKRPLGPQGKARMRFNESCAQTHVPQHRLRLQSFPGHRGCPVCERKSWTPATPSLVASERVDLERYLSNIFWQ